MNTDFINLTKNIKINRTNYLKINLTPNSNSDLDKIAKELYNFADIVELAGENITTRTFLNIAQKVKQLCAEFNKTLIIKDRLDIALLSEADGVFLPNGSIPLECAHKILPENYIIGTDNISNADYFLMENISEQRNAKPCFAKTKVLDNFVYYTLLDG